MILLRDFALFILPAIVAAGGWLFALSLRKQARLKHDPDPKGRVSAKGEAVFRKDHASTAT